MKINLSSTCGNSPKNKFVQDYRDKNKSYKISVHCIFKNMTNSIE